MNSTNGQLTYPATMAAMHVLEHGDTYLSHKTTVYYHKAFSARWLAHEDFDQQLPHDLVLTDSAQPWTCVDDYLKRPEALEDFSPTLMHMFFEKKRKDKLAFADDTAVRRGTLQRLSFPPDHPHCETHMLIARTHPALLQFIATPPTQPSDTADDDVLQG
jgi:hypothetical protein